MLRTQHLRSLINILESFEDDSCYSFEQAQPDFKKDKKQCSKDLFYSSFQTQQFHDRRLFFFLCLAGLKIIKRYLKYSVSDQMKEFLGSVYQNFLRSKTSHAKVLWKVCWVFTHGFLKDFFEKQRPFMPLYAGIFRTEDIFNEMFDSITNMMKFLLQADSKKIIMFFQKWLKMNFKPRERPVFRNYVFDSFILENVLKFCLIEEDKKTARAKAEDPILGNILPKTSNFSPALTGKLNALEIMSKSSIPSINIIQPLEKQKTRKRSVRSHRKHHYAEGFFERLELIGSRKEELEDALQILETENEKNRQRGSHNFYFYFTFPDDFKLMGLHSKKGCPPEFEKRLLKFLGNREDHTRSRLNFWGLSLGDNYGEGSESSMRGSRNRSFYSSRISSRRVSRSNQHPYASETWRKNSRKRASNDGSRSSKSDIQLPHHSTNRAIEEEEHNRSSIKQACNSIFELEPIPEKRENEEIQTESNLKRLSDSPQETQHLQIYSPKKSKLKNFKTPNNKANLSRSNINTPLGHSSESKASKHSTDHWPSTNKPLQDPSASSENNIHVKLFSDQDMSDRFNLSPFTVGNVFSKQPIKDFLSKEDREAKFTGTLDYVSLIMSSIRLSRKKNLNMLLLMNHMVKHKEGLKELFKMEGDAFIYNKMGQDLYNQNELHFDVLQIFRYLKVVVFKKNETMRIGNESLFLHQTTVENVLKTRMNRLDQMTLVYKRNVIACSILFKLKLKRVQIKYKDIDMVSYQKYFFPF